MHHSIASRIFLALTVTSFTVCTACNAIPELGYDDSADSSGDAANATDARSDHPDVADGSWNAPVDAKIDESDSPSEPDTSFPSTDDASLLDVSVHDASILDTSTPDTSTHDSGAHDAGAHDAAAPDAGSLTCPAGLPPGASVCCGSVPCSGASSSCTSECTNCKNNCAGKACCMDQNGNFHGCADTAAQCGN